MNDVCCCCCCLPHGIRSPSYDSLFLFLDCFILHLPNMQTCTVSLCEPVVKLVMKNSCFSLARICGLFAYVYTPRYACVPHSVTVAQRAQCQCRWPYVRIQLIAASKRTTLGASRTEPTRATTTFFSHHCRVSQTYIHTHARDALCMMGNNNNINERSEYVAPGLRMSSASIAFIIYILCVNVLFRICFDRFSVLLHYYSPLRTTQCCVCHVCSMYTTLQISLEWSCRPYVSACFGC